MCLAITGCSGQQIKPTTTEEQKIAVQTQTQTEVEVTEAETEPTVETEKPTENTVRRAIKDLEKAELIRKEYEFRSNGSCTSNRYYLL